MCIRDRNNISVEATAGANGIATITVSDYVSTAGVATTATTVTVTASSTSSNFKIPFLNTTSQATGNYELLHDSSTTLIYNPSLNRLTVPDASITTLSAGTISASTKIDLSDDDYIEFGEQNDVKVFYDGTANDLEIELESTANKIAITDNGTYKHLITRDGKVGINTSVTPTVELEVNGNANISGVITATAYYGDGSNLSGIVAGGGFDGFNTGISSSIQLTPLSYETSIYTFPSTAGKQYVIESINVANVDTSVGVGTTVNIIASIEDSSGEQTYIAYNVPIVNGGLIELLKNPIVAGPSDVIKMWTTNNAYIGVNNATEVYMNYAEFDSTEYISEYASTVSIATTDATAVYTSSTYPSTIEAIHLANRTDTGDYPVSVSITNGLTTTYLAKNLIIPRYATVDILDRPKRVETNGVIKVEVGQTSTIDVIIAGKQITS